MKNNHTKYAIMGVLTTGCRSGYEIKQMIDQSLNHFWKVSYGQIYPTLKQLLEEGLATVQETVQEGKPDKKEYFLTQKGDGELRMWLEAPLEGIPTEKNEVLLKIFFSRHGSKDKILGHIETYRDRLQERYQVYSGIEATITTYSPTSPDLKYWLLTLDYGKRVTQAALDWCDHAIQKILE